MYAHNTTLTSSAEEPCVLEHKINYDMNLIQSWLSANKQWRKLNSDLLLAYGRKIDQQILNLKEMFA